MDGILSGCEFCTYKNSNDPAQSPTQSGNVNSKKRRRLNGALDKEHPFGRQRFIAGKTEFESASFKGKSYQIG